MDKNKAVDHLPMYTVTKKQRKFLYADLSLKDHLNSLGYREVFTREDLLWEFNMLLVWPDEKHYAQVQRITPIAQPKTTIEELETEIAIVKLGVWDRY